MTTTMAPRAMVVSADALATQAGVDVLRRGGSAADAAIATNAVLAVTAPHLCGMGGDLFAVVQAGGSSRPVVLDAAGRAGSGADPDRLRAEGHREMPFRGDARSITVPGCVDGWLALHARFGRMPIAEVLAAAAAYASEGFPASPLLAGSVAGLPSPRPPGAEDYADLHDAGQRVRRPGAARALAAIASHGRDGFYGGEFGAGLRQLGASEYVADDLARPLATWVEPLGMQVWGHDVWTVPPPSQGYLTLAGAWVASRLDLGDDPADGRWARGLTAAAIATGRDRPELLWEGARGDDLLAPNRLEGWLAAARAGDPAGRPGVSGKEDRRRAADDTTYLCAVDAGGMAVSLIQSNASGFGSHVFEPSTGINLHNRGIGFSLVAGHPAEYGPGRRPPHTLCPALVTRTDGSVAAVLGTQGGDGQPQILLQVLARLLGAGEPASRAIGSRRWVLSGTGQGFDTWTAGGGLVVLVEDGAPAGWVPELSSLGHRVEVRPAFDHGFGHANLIVRDTDGMLAGAADPRARIGAAAGI